MSTGIRLPPLLSLRAFEAAARHLSFTDAGSELHLTQGAISRHIKLLEEHLKAKLFARYIRRVELTDVGKEYFLAVQTALLDIERATKSAMRDSRQCITLDVLPTLNSLWLMPRLASFTEAYPNIELRLVSSISPVDFRTHEVDVAIRVGRFPGRTYPKRQPRIELEMVESWKDVTAQHLFQDVLIPVISRKLLEQGRPITTPADLLSYRLIHTASRRYAWGDWLDNYGLRVPARADQLDFGHFFMAIRGAKDCKGVAIVPKIFFENFSHDPDLVCPLPGDIESAGAYYLLTRESQSNDPSVRLLVKWILAEAEQIAERSLAET